MNFGLSPSQWKIVMRLAIDPLKKGGAQVWVFGSRATGKHRKFSDLDLLFTTPSGSPIPPARISDLREALEESELAIKVDLVDLDELATSYRDEVLRVRKPV